MKLWNFHPRSIWKRHPEDRSDDSGKRSTTDGLLEICYSWEDSRIRSLIRQNEDVSRAYSNWIPEPVAESGTYVGFQFAVSLERASDSPDFDPYLFDNAKGFEHPDNLPCL